LEPIHRGALLSPVAARLRSLAGAQGHRRLDGFARDGADDSLGRVAALTIAHATGGALDIHARRHNRRGLSPGRRIAEPSGLEMARPRCAVVAIRSGRADRGARRRKPLRKDRCRHHSYARRAHAPSTDLESRTVRAAHPREPSRRRGRRWFLQSLPLAAALPWIPSAMLGGQPFRRTFSSPRCAQDCRMSRSNARSSASRSGARRRRDARRRGVLGSSSPGPIPCTFVACP
jgi:hypothetical protein